LKKIRLFDFLNTLRKNRIKSVWNFLAFLLVLFTGIFLLCVFYAVSQLLYLQGVILLGYYSFLVFVPLAGILAWGLLFFFKETEISTEEFVEKKINFRFVRKILLWLLKMKMVAFVASALFLGPIITPPLIKTCIPNDKKKAYFWSIALNMLSAAFWLGFTLGGWKLAKHYWSAIKLSVGA